MRVFCVCLLLFSSWVYAGVVKDDSGQTISLVKPATRVISLAPDLTEILFAIGAGKNIVGVMQGSDYPDAAKKITVVANYASLNQEAIVSLHPDLIVAWDVGNTTEEIKFFKKFHIPVYLTHPLQISDVAKTIRNLGCLLGQENIANALAIKYLHRLQLLKEKYSHRKKVTVFYEVWANPLMTINKNSWINQAITLCGGVNIFANVKGAVPLINIEAVLAANPDFIIGNKDEWQQWTTLNAVKQQHVFKLSKNLLERAGPRLIEGVSQMCESLQKY